MRSDTRLNILLTHSAPRSQETAGIGYQDRQPWYQMLTHLLAPMGVQTFEATTGPRALELIEQHPIHLAVVDACLRDVDGLGVLRVIQKIRQRAQAADYLQGRDPPANEPPRSMRVQVRMQSTGAAQRIEVKFGAPPPHPPRAGGNEGGVWPTVILVTPNRDEPQVLQEALTQEAFSVMSEPVDLELMLDVMARAMKRFHRNLWPQ